MRKIYLQDQAGEQHAVPAKHVVCDSCQGNGSVENPAFSNGFTSSEWDDMGREEQGRYMAGDYDVMCPECKGERVQAVPDVARCTFGQKRLVVLARQAAELDARVMRQIRHEEAAERRAFGY